jgi:hypothetical protein
MATAAKRTIVTRRAIGGGYLGVGTGLSCDGAL